MVVGINSDAMLANKWKCLINNNKMTPGSLFFFFLVVFCFWRKPVWPNENWSSIFPAIFWNSISKSQPVTLVQLTLVHVGDVVLKIPHLPIRFTLFEMSWTLTYYACQLLIWLQKKFEINLVKIATTSLVIINKTILIFGCSNTHFFSVYDTLTLLIDYQFCKMIELTEAFSTHDV